MAEVLSVRNKWVLIRQGRSSLEALCWDVPVTEQMRGDFLVEFYGRTRICVVSLLDETAILRKSRAATTS
jgi:hypothetical protein